MLIYATTCLWFMTCFCSNMCILYSVVCLIVIVVNHQNGYLFYYTHHCHGLIPTEFWSCARAQPQMNIVYWTLRSLKVESLNEFSLVFVQRNLEPVLISEPSENVIVPECRRLLSARSHSQSSCQRTTEKLRESHRIQPCLHGYPEHLASRKAPVITLLAIFTADKLTMRFWENVWALKRGNNRQEKKMEKNK